jgi:hypothetical protein
MAQQSDLERKLRNLLQSSITFDKKPPSRNKMLDGEIKFVLSKKGERLRMYVKESGVLWYLEFLRSSEPSQIVWGSS